MSAVPSQGQAGEGRVLGIGLDLCLCPRIGEVIGRHGERFLARIFTPAERAYVERLGGRNRTGAYAKRWAAKEACAKALGTGFARGVAFRDIEVRRNAAGAPELALSGGARQVLAALTAPGHRAQLFLSMSDDGPFAMAQVLIQQHAL
ncbi:holo-ACP synthase [Oecophyllibacter saccharovorans]|uniref:Holo-[acyl-carrier-protein] synthase n=1 Tax=Oecophyllibacter saccharovorans TaxID=2558360 RepID=A0A506UQN5_9PROT|nr:holo-ACP synthase [Oecophyllibacter saccharovorans]TPW35433.1 holo-ACP synthase [Oecophyllibacter saccharovorans]